MKTYAVIDSNSQVGAGEYLPGDKDHFYVCTVDGIKRVNIS